MSATQSEFPDLDAALALERVEVVSSVEIETVKRALRWLFDELQRQRAPADSTNAAITSDDLQALRKSGEEQKAVLAALQEQQGKLLQRSTEVEQGLQALQQLPDAVQRMQASQQANAGASEQLLILQQQLKALKDGQARFSHDIAALQANSPSASSSAAGEQSQAGQQRPASNSPTASGDTTVVSGASASNSPNAPSANSSEGGAVSPTAEGRAAGSSLGTDAGKFGQRLDDLSKEVAELQSAMAAMGSPVTTAQPAIASPTNQSSSASPSTAVTAASTSPASAGSAALASLQRGASSVKQQQPEGTDQAGNLTRDEQNRNQEAGDRLAALSNALAAVKEQVGGQSRVLGEVRAAEGELRRLLADKAGLADVQALLQAHSAPLLLPVPQGGSAAEAGMAGAINGLGAKVGSLEALLSLTQQRIADKADAAELAALRAALSKLTAAIGDEALPNNPVGVSSTQPEQADSAQLTKRLSQLQQQIEALTINKANKADLEALQLHAAVLGGGGTGSGSGDINGSGGSSGSGCSHSDGSAAMGNGGAVTRGMAGLLEAVQKMVAGKADKEEVQGLMRVLGDKVDLADHQAACNNLERSLLAVQTSPVSARSTAGLLGAAPAMAPASPRGPAGGGGRGGAGFVPVRPATRSILVHDENEVPGGDLASLREEVQQLKGIVDVLTSATHLMAIPTASDVLGRRTTGEVEVGVTDLVQGGASSGNTSAIATTAATTAAGGTLSALPTAATAAAAAAAAAIAGLGTRAAGEGAAPGKPGASHTLTGLSSQKQGNGKDGLSVAGTGPRATLHSPTVPNSTPRPDGSNPDILLAHQESGTGGEGQVGGPLQELMSSMKAGQLGHKMNDSDIHDQLAQRLTTLERLVKRLTLQPQGSGHVAGAVAGKGPDERLLRRLGSDLAVVKKRLDEIAPPKDPGALAMMRDGDHAMLAGKPLQGYRCMACDRPLAKLDPDMGGFVPGPHMPISVSFEPSKNNGVVLSSKEGPGQGRSGTSRKGPPAAQHSRTALHAQQPQTGEDPVTPQNWLKEAQGQPAQALPKEDVGPHLPPGGWRAGTSQGTRAPKGSTRPPGTRPVAENDEMAAWDTQATVPLPDIYAKS
ncbi:hypothetical protein WJX77_003396 [Trebouxia sp. C0004]